jgi:hypothetical protein
MILYCSKENCNKLCKVSEYTALGRNHKFKVYMIHHKSYTFIKEKTATDYI